MNSLTHVFGSSAEGLSPQAAARASNKNFVRSGGQLAVYEPSRSPTGHVLTAWEAFTAYGLSVLEEAADYGSAILRRTQESPGTVLKRRREALDLSAQSVARAAKITLADLKSAESGESSVSLSTLERVAFVLGLDERLLAYDVHSGGDDKLAYRLKMLVGQGDNSPRFVSAGTALLFAEAASIARVQLRLQGWLTIPMEKDHFEIHKDYGSPSNPAWSIGYRLAEDCRRVLGLGESPVSSMRELVEKRLGIPVIQARLRQEIAGATVSTRNIDGEQVRGVILNTVGANKNVWVRRATLAHELGHLLYDAEESLESVRVDSYVDSQKDPQRQGVDFVEQRANAFAIAFLAPNDMVRDMTPSPISEESVYHVMRTFGISQTAARYHVANSHYKQDSAPFLSFNLEPTDEQKAAEDFTLDYFPILSTPDQRRGKISTLVAICYDQGLLSEETASLYLRCTPDEFTSNLAPLRELHSI